MSPAFLLLAAIGCDTTVVCCDTVEGPRSLIASSCDTRALPVSECAEDVGDTAFGPTHSCTSFCQAILFACPQTEQCFETCVVAPFEPGFAATRCADAALDCAGAAACWDLITGSPL